MNAYISPFSGNVISKNWIGRNNVRTDSRDLKTPTYP